MMTSKEFKDGWMHFLKCVNFEYTALDAKAIRFMNEMPGQVHKALLAANTKKKYKEGSSKCLI